VPHKQPLCPGDPFDLHLMWLNSRVTLTKQKSLPVRGSWTEWLAKNKKEDGMSDSSPIPSLFVAMVLLG
jgi:hypothetical protein